jgi:hypothetical protein
MVTLLTNWGRRAGAEALSGAAEAMTALAIRRASCLLDCYLAVF